MAGLTGLEPATFRVTGGRSNQTELQPQHRGKEIRDIIVPYFCGFARKIVRIIFVKWMLIREGLKLLENQKEKIDNFFVHVYI